VTWSRSDAVGFLIAVKEAGHAREGEIEERAVHLAECRPHMALSNGQVSAAVGVNGELRTTPTDLPANALCPIYSITKTLTTICVLRLTESGFLSIDASVVRWLPQVEVPATITVTHLLRHTSGLRDYGPLPEYHQAVRTHPDQPWTRRQFLDAALSKGLLLRRERAGLTRTSHICCSSTLSSG
jgi:CubicO group peptidase (beta-lactamase class C family)